MRDSLHPAMILDATAAMDAQDARIARCNTPDCYFCDSQDGMEAWSAENIRDARASDDYPLPQLYRLRERPLEEHEHLFTPCCECNRAGRVDRKQYAAVSDKMVGKWLEEER